LKAKENYFILHQHQTLVLVYITDESDFRTSPWPRWVPVCIRCTLSYSADAGMGPF